MHPSILIVNDDSIFSEGIKALWEAMSELGKTTVAVSYTHLTLPTSLAV